jgi:alpha-mannosidase
MLRIEYKDYESGTEIVRNWWIGGAFPLPMDGLVVKLQADGHELQFLEEAIRYYQLMKGDVEEAI